MFTTYSYTNEIVRAIDAGEDAPLDQTATLKANIVFADRKR